MTEPSRLPRSLRRLNAANRAALPPYPVARPDVCTCPDLPAGHDDDECALASRRRIARCKCTHPKRNHGTDRRDRATCFGSAMCACTTYRPQETT